MLLPDLGLTLHVVYSDIAAFSRYSRGGNFDNSSCYLARVIVQQLNWLDCAVFYVPQLLNWWTSVVLLLPNWNANIKGSPKMVRHEAIIIYYNLLPDAKPMNALGPPAWRGLELKCRFRSRHGGTVHEERVWVGIFSRQSNVGPVESRDM